MSFSSNPDFQAVLDGMGQGILIFSPDGKLVTENLTARTMLGTDLSVIRQAGWSAAAVLFNQQLPDSKNTLEAARTQALTAGRPVRFRTYRSGELLPCWVGGVHGPNGVLYTMLTMEQPDWQPLTEILDRFGDEFRTSVESANGHIRLIAQVMNTRRPEETPDQLAKRIVGFTKLVDTQMVRSARLLSMVERLGAVRVGTLREQVRAGRRRITLDSYLEDLAEEINKTLNIDPDSKVQDVRARLDLNIPAGLVIEASPNHLMRVLHDILANAIMYSMRGTPIHIAAQRRGGVVQVDVTDEGYGIRDSERERVFTPFQRARQPQIMGEFGYGLSLYLCKQEVEAMNGRIWFDSAEGAGTVVSITLPAATGGPVLPSSADILPEEA
jgi:signal transduction histidine kinase